MAVQTVSRLREIDLSSRRVVVACERRSRIAFWRLVSLNGDSDQNISENYNHKAMQEGGRGAQDPVHKTQVRREQLEDACLIIVPSVSAL